MGKTSFAVGGTLLSAGRKSIHRAAGRALAGLILLAALVPAAAAAGEPALTVIDSAASYPEGPLVRDGVLYYAEMGRDRVMRFDGQASAVLWTMDHCGPTSVARLGGERLLVLCHLGDAVVVVDLAGNTVRVIDRDASGRSFTNPNASSADAKGGVYFSSSGVFAPKAPATGAVLYLDASGRLTRLAEDIHYANGVAVSADGRTLYVSEHLSRRVLAFDIARDGSLANRRTFVALDDLEGADASRGWELGPDGLALDRNGNVYIAEYGAGHFLIVDPAGTLIATIAVPERYTTALALSADETRLFVTAPDSLYPTGTGVVYSLANPAHAPD